jgi:predicted metal-dependent HD superfamily phosphohydrolase
MEFERVKGMVLDKLEQDLHPSLYYHNVEHTLDVMASVDQLAAGEGVNGTDLAMLKTAALFHDAGYLWAYDDNEHLACSYARKSLPAFHYSGQQIDAVCRLIMATAIPQEPDDQLGMILCDADLDYIGRDDFFSIANKLHMEWTKNHDRVIDSREWYTRQYLFFLEHDYFTASARKLRDEKKKKNKVKIEKLLAIYDDPRSIEEFARVLAANPAFKSFHQ